MSRSSVIDKARDQEGFHNSQLFSSEGLLYQMAFADRSTYNSLFTFFYRLKGGWLIVEEGKPHLKKAIEEEDCGLSRDNSGDHLYDRSTKYLARFFGHWFSRINSRCIILSEIDQMWSSLVKPTESPLMLRRVLERLQLNKTCMNPQLRNRIDQEYIPRPYPQPLEGHGLIMIGTHHKGFQLMPSGYYKVSDELYLGGDTKDRCDQKVQKTISTLDLSHQLNVEDLKSKSKTVLRQTGEEGDLSVSFLRDSDWLIEALGYASTKIKLEL